MALKIGQKLNKIELMICSRQLWTARVQSNYKRSAEEKQGRLLRKMMAGGSRKKWYQYMDAFDKVQPLSADFLKPKKTHASRRAHVLNSVILQTVSDVLSTGELGPDLTGLGLEITQVKVSSDYSSVNIFWMTSIAETTGQLEKDLPRTAGKLKNIMCGLQIMGNVPHVNFVKDRQFQSVKDVEYALSRADFGPDFQPTDKSHRLKSKANIPEQIPDSAELRGMKEETSEVPFSSEPLIATSTTSPPDMRMDIFHLNHREISAQIMRNINRAKATHRTSDGGIPVRMTTEAEEISGGDTDCSQFMPAMPETDAELRRLLKRNAKQNLRSYDSKELDSLSNENQQQYGIDDSSAEIHEEEEDDQEQYFDEDCDVSDYKKLQDDK